MDVTQRYVAKVEYIGTNYFGWQSQSHSEPTIQTTIQKALSQLANHPVTIFCSGRTDKGVHAKGQIIHFDSSSKRSIDNWLSGGNRLLPDDISLQTVQCVDADFHARYHAYERCYEYLILNQPQPSALYAKRAYYMPHCLHLEAMQQAANYLIGKHDFNAFKASGCQAKSTVKTMKEIAITKQDSLVSIHFRADAYLYHMVRNICACLLAVGRQRHTPQWLQYILQGKDRTLAPAMLPAHGLYLSSVHYPSIIT